MYRRVDYSGVGLPVGWIIASRLTAADDWAGRAVRWELTDGGFRVRVDHLDAAGTAVSYEVDLSFVDRPNGGQLTYFECPGCGRRCSHLYLPADRDRLGCRGCSRMKYRCQYPAADPARALPGAHAVRRSVTVSRGSRPRNRTWNPATGWVTDSGPRSTVS